MSANRAAAAAALLLGLLAVAVAAWIALHSFPRGLLALALVGVAVAGAWFAIAGRPAGRLLGLTVAGLALAGAVLLMIGDHLVAGLLLIAAVVLCSASTRWAFDVGAELPAASAPLHPVLLVNPHSGGGKAERFRLAEEARRRGIAPILLDPGSDLAELARAAVGGGADALAVAGGDGSQAAVAAVAAEHDIPFACVPSGTRNHFAVDLGVDRGDVVGALDALVDGGERRIDLGEVNGRAFVNNVSLGLYASAVQRTGYRSAKVRTLLETVPAALGPGGAGIDLRWAGPGGREHRSGIAILVANNRYRLGRAVGSGTRPRLDAGLLGITVAGEPEAGGDGGRPWREWSAAEFEVDAGEPVPAGIDGEAATLEPPLRFRIRPGALRVRISRRHPGASPSAALPEGFVAGALALARLAAGADPGPPAGTVRRSG